METQFIQPTEFHYLMGFAGLDITRELCAQYIIPKGPSHLRGAALAMKPSELERDIFRAFIKDSSLADTIGEVVIFYNPTAITRDEDNKVINYFLRADPAYEPFNFTVTDTLTAKLLKQMGLDCEFNSYAVSLLDDKYAEEKGLNAPSNLYHTSILRLGNQ